MTASELRPLLRNGLIGFAVGLLLMLGVGFIVAPPGASAAPAAAIR